MARFDRFEDIEAWKEAKVLAADVYRLTNQGTFRRDFGLKDQVRRAAVSVMANIAEGFGRKTNKDFAHFLYLSKGSAMEVISHLYIAKELDYIDNQTFEPLYRGYSSIIAKLSLLTAAAQEALHESRSSSSLESTGRFATTQEPLVRLVRYLESNPRPHSKQTTRNQEPGTRN